MSNHNFDSKYFFGGPIVQTLLGASAGQSKSQKYSPTVYHVPVSDGDELAILEYKNETAKNSILLVPGLGSSARAPNIQRQIRHFLSLNWSVYAMNHRGSGDGRDRAKGIYHSGRSNDVASALAFAAAKTSGKIIIVAHSLGANMVLRHIGRSHAGLEQTLPESYAGTIALSPILNLKDASNIMPKIAFGLFDRQFIKSIRRYVERRHRSHPDLGAHGLPAKLTLPEFDALYTFKAAGYASVDDYYDDASALPWLNQVLSPAIVMASSDDPLRKFERYQWPGNFRVHMTKSGGHLGCVLPLKAASKRFWLDHQTSDYAQLLLEKDQDG